MYKLNVVYLIALALSALLAVTMIVVKMRETRRNKRPEIAPTKEHDVKYDEDIKLVQELHAKKFEDCGELCRACKVRGYTNCDKMCALCFNK